MIFAFFLFELILKLAVGVICSKLGVTSVQLVWGSYEANSAVNTARNRAPILVAWLERQESRKLILYSKPADRLSFLFSTVTFSMFADFTLCIIHFMSTSAVLVGFTLLTL